MKDFAVIKCFIAIINKNLYRKLIYAHLSRIVANKIYALFTWKVLVKKSLLPGKFLSFPPLPPISVGTFIDESPKARADQSGPIFFLAKITIRICAGATIFWGGNIPYFLAQKWVVFMGTITSSKTWEECQNCGQNSFWVDVLYLKKINKIGQSYPQQWRKYSSNAYVGCHHQLDNHHK